MRFVYVLEDDPKFQKEICEAIVFIDPKIQIRLFSKLENFVNWVRLMMTDGPAAISRGGLAPTIVAQEPLVEEEHRLVLVISKIEFLGVKQLNLLRKTRGLFVERKICTVEDPTSIVLTAFDDPNFKMRELEDRILTNIIFKPFDRLILIQHLTLAIDGRHPPSKFTIQNQKTTAVFEMLKEVPIEAISEFGFVTRSNRKIDKGSLAKYYGKPFVTERLSSIMAICDSCEPHREHLDSYQVTVRLFAADPTQISNLRKRVRVAGLAKEVTMNWPRPDVLGDGVCEVIIIDPDEDSASGVGATLSRKFKSLKVTHYNSFKEFYLDFDPTQMNNKDEIPAKPFSSGSEISFIYDSIGVKLLEIERADKAPLEIFGIPEAEFIGKSQWLLAHLIEEHKEKLRRIFKEKNTILADPNFLVVHEGQNYLLQLSANEVQPSGRVSLKFREASKDEWIQFLKKNSRCPEKISAIIFSHRFLGENPQNRWAVIQEQIEKRGQIRPMLFLLSAKEYSDAEERELALFLSDIFFRPVDRNYLALKFHYLFPKLQVIDEPLDLRTVSEHEPLRAANPVTISEISEAGFVMQYKRAISIGSFREMLLWQPYEVGAPILLSNCNFTEEVPGKKDEFNCHFVFFGMTDHFLKNIRFWIRDNYILSKEKS